MECAAVQAVSLALSRSLTDADVTTTWQLFFVRSSGTAVCCVVAFVTCVGRERERC